MKWNKTGHCSGLSSPKREQARYLLNFKLYNQKTKWQNADVLITENTDVSENKIKLFNMSNKRIINIEDFAEFIAEEYPELLL